MTVLAALGTFALAHAGLTGLALTMDRHHRQLRPAAPRPDSFGRATSRLVAWTLLALSLWASLLAWGTANGAVAWFGVLSTTALALILSLPYAPALAWRLGRFTCAVGLMAVLATLSGASI